MSIKNVVELFHVKGGRAYLRGGRPFTSWYIGLFKRWYIGLFKKWYLDLYLKGGTGLFKRWYRPI